MSTTLETTNIQWKMTVNYDQSANGRTMASITASTVFISICISVLAFIVLRQRKIHTDGILAQQTKVDTERNMTAYFAHEL